MVALESFWYGAQGGRIWQITSCGGFARCCHYTCLALIWHDRQYLGQINKNKKNNNIDCYYVVKVQQMQNICFLSYVQCSAYIWGRIIWIYNIIFINNIFLLLLFLYDEIKRQVSSVATNLLENCHNRTLGNLCQVKAN